MSENTNGEGFTVERFRKSDRMTNIEYKRAPEKDSLERGEIDLHSPDAVEKCGELEGRPVDDRTVATPLPPELPKLADPQPPPNGMPRILLAVPILAVTYEFFQSFLKFWQEVTIACQGKYEIGYQFVYRKPVHIAETMAANSAIFNKCTHLLLMDDDILDITPAMLEKLLAADKDVIAGVMYTSKFPFAACTFRRYETDTTVASQPAQKSMYRLYEIPCQCPVCLEKKNTVTRFSTWETDFCPICRTELKDFAVQPIDLVPFPFTLIKTSVFERIKKPWFHCNTIFPTDSWFADRCIEVSIQEYAHMTVRLNHGGVNDITRGHRFNEGLAIAQGKGNVCELSKQDMELHMKMIEGKMQEAEERSKRLDSPKFLRQAPVEAGAKGG